MSGTYDRPYSFSDSSQTINNQLSGFEYFIYISSTQLLHYVMSFWSTTSILRVRKTNRQVRHVCGSYMRVAWDLNAYFRDWFDTKELRSILHRCNAIISGSQALSFFNRERYPDSDLDFFVRLGGVQELTDWLERQGYVECMVEAVDTYDVVTDRVTEIATKCVGNHSSPDHTLLGVVNFLKVRDPGRVEYRVQVVIVDTEPIEHVLFDFHSTVVMNYISSMMAVSVFPRSTVIDRISFVTKIRIESEERTKRWKRKYEDRGFSIIDGESDAPLWLENSLVCGRRDAMDSLCWKIYLDVQYFPRSVFGPMRHKVAFDVMPRATGVVCEGAYVRIAEPVIWRMMALHPAKPQGGEVDRVPL